MRMSEFMKRQVVDIHNGNILGVVSDFEISVHEMCVSSIVITFGGGKLHRLLPCFFKGQESVIPLRCVIKIDGDVILVDCKS